MEQAIVNYSTRLKTLQKRIASRIAKLEGFQKRAGMCIALNEYTSMTDQVATWTSQCESAEFQKAEICISSRTAYEGTVPQLEFSVGERCIPYSSVGKVLAQIQI